MKKMIKTAIVTTTLLASASIFAQNVGVNANGSAQVNVESGGLIKGVTGAVKNTAQGVGHVAQHVGHAAVDTGVNATQKTVGVATHVSSQVINKTGEAVKNTRDYTVDKANDGKKFTADQKANIKKRIEEKQTKSKALNLNAETNLNTQVNGKTSSLNAKTGLNADRKNLQTGANLGVKVLGVNANVNTNAKVGTN
ncbi:hypothetical protein [uncultured Acinetobacter sp.]|uniref:hypothetical protein n=1 Tax=uncultured Acinetobacter sp. TaxID=165433 RepID=UPI0025DA3348|nr:hypothetical protein [uncultured Acinetobacter sp.]